MILGISHMQIYFCKNWTGKILPDKNNTQKNWKFYDYFSKAFTIIKSNK